MARPDATTGTDGEVANAPVCKTGIHGFKSHSVLHNSCGNELASPIGVRASLGRSASNSDMRYTATIFVELRDFDVARIAEADRELQSLMHREGFNKHGAEFTGPTNKEALELQKHLNETVLPQLKLVGSAYADITHHRDA